jgi:ClpP class serine protease
MTQKRVSAFEMIASQLWAITPDALETICNIARHENESPEAVAAKLGRPLQNTRTVTVRDGVAIIPVTGPIFRYANMFTEVSGATSLDILARDFRAAVEDPSIKAIVLEMDTPGGQAKGIAEFAQQVRAATADKKVIAYVDGAAASAGYWIASAASEIVVNKTSEVGSIGAVVSVAIGNDPGYVDIISSQSPKKWPDASTEAGRAQLQARIDALAQVFIETVAANRGVSVETVLADFGQGDIRLGIEAVQLGMADRVSVLEDVIAGLAGATNNGGSQAMATENKATPAAEQPVITREYLAEHHSDIVSAIEDDAMKIGEDAGREAGMKAERARVQAILDTPLANTYGEIVSAAIANGDKPETVSTAILAAEAKGKDDALASQKADAPAPLEQQTEIDEGLDVNASIEDRAKAEWDKNENLRAEFGEDFGLYVSFKKGEANDKYRVRGSKK